MDVSGLPKHTWVGESGELYTYFVRPWPTRLAPVAGNYVFARRESDLVWTPVLIGESADLSTLVTAALERRGVDARTLTHVHTRPNVNPASARRREVQDLMTRWNPAAKPT